MAETPKAQYLSAEHVLEEMCAFGASRIEHLRVVQLFMLGLMGGSFITAGALFSVLLSDGITVPAVKHLLASLGFSTGFFFVVISHTALFTGANVVLPAVLLYRHTWTIVRKVVRYWVVVWVGNLAGALLVGWLVTLAQSYGSGFEAELQGLIDKKSAYAAVGTTAAWGQAVLSGVLAVTLFVAANFQHSPANMGYFSLATPLDIGPGWGVALWWNIIPAGIGNMLGGAFLVVLPFWFALHPDTRTRTMEAIGSRTKTHPREEAS